MKLQDAHSLSAEVMFRLMRGLEGISSPALEIPRILSTAAVPGLYPDCRQELRYHKLQAVFNSNTMLLSARAHGSFEAW